MSFNETSMNVSKECSDFGTGYFVATFYLLLSIPGIVLYSFTLFILIVKYKQLSSTFYLLAIALAAADILTLCLTAFYGVPCILKCGYVLSFITPYVFAWVTHFCWYLQITFIFIISLNRFICMRSKAFKQYDNLFSTKNMIGYIAGSFCFSLGTILMMNFMSCLSSYNYTSYYFQLTCSNSYYGPIAQITNLVICDVIIAATALIYMVSWIMVKIKRKRALATTVANIPSGTNVNQVQHAARKKAESRLFWQFVIVSSVLVLYEISFFILPLMVSNATAITVITGTIYIAVCSMNGYLHICFNSVIQAEVKQLAKNIISKLNWTSHFV